MSMNSDRHDLHDSLQHREDEEVRKAFLELISFIAIAKAPHSSKGEALEAIRKLQEWRLP